MRAYLHFNFYSKGMLAKCNILYYSLNKIQGKANKKAGETKKTLLKRAFCYIFYRDYFSPIIFLSLPLSSINVKVVKKKITICNRVRTARLPGIILVNIVHDDGK
ncbi:hypothetical protein SAMN05444144_11638 [Flavobacterium akiainvivens]|nr:hypothetical protein SAMN05444144_11638 [Flavobacterium akiainvivens]